MPTVFIPTQLRQLTAGIDRAEVSAANVRDLIAALELRFPGISERLIDDGQLAAGLIVSIDGQVNPRGVRAALGARSEVHFLPAIGGG